MDKQIIQNLLLWAARITGTIILAFLIYMLVGHLLTEGFPAFKFENYTEILLFMMFPVLTILALIVAYRKPIQGGFFVIFSMLMFFGIQRGDLNYNIYFLSPFIPGLLYILYGIVSKQKPT